MTMTAREFERSIERAFLALPEGIRKKVENVAFVVERRADDGHYEEDDADNHEGELLGLYVGVPLTERGIDVSGLLPDKIILFRDTIEEEAAERENGDVDKVVRETLWHEIGHFFGFGEDEVRRLEKKWEGKTGH